MIAYEVTAVSRINTGNLHIFVPVEEKMSDTKTLIERAYAAFNERNVDGALALMSDDVSWPKASEGGKVVGKEEVRAYWTRQWAAFDPHVEPLETIDLGGDKLEVRVAPACEEPSRRRSLR